jgi:hypothetical protein
MRDLTNIPERFHVLFTTDWNKGNESKMNSIQRGQMGDLYLEYNRWEIQQSIRNKKPDEPETMVGFVD